MKSIFPNKERKSSTVQSIITDEGEIITSKSTIVEKFNIFFTNSVSKLLESIQTTTVLGLSDEKFTNESFLLQPVSQNLIFKQLKDLKVKKATGLDGISAQFLKDGVSVIAPTVTPLVNLSLSTGIVPCDWKMAHVFPLYMSGGHESTDNYRPISILPILSKIIEKAVNVQLQRNKCSEQFIFFKDVSDILKGARVEQDHPFIVDINIILDHVLDGQGGNSKRKDSGKIVEDMSAELDLVEIWRIRNPTVTPFTWRQKKPVIQRRLDYWLVSDSLQDEIDSVDIKTSIKSDHSAITLSINGVDDLEKGPNFWKFNSNLVNDSTYCEFLTTEYANWLEEFKEVQDKRVLWDLIKYKIRQQTIRYSKTKACKRRAKLQNLEKDLKECTEKCNSDPNTKILDELECLCSDRI